MKIFDCLKCSVRTPPQCLQCVAQQSITFLNFVVLASHPKLLNDTLSFSSDRLLLYIVNRAVFLVSLVKRRIPSP